MKNIGMFLQRLVLVCTAAAGLSPLGAALATLENPKVRIDFDLSTGSYSIFDKRSGAAVIEDACYAINADSSTGPGHVHTALKSLVNDTLGPGNKLTITSAKPGAPTMFLECALYGSNGYVVLNAGVQNTGTQPIYVKSMQYMQRGVAFKNADFQDYGAIDGWDGKGDDNPSNPPSPVGHTTNHYSGAYANSVTCDNNIIATFGGPSTKHSIVVGGLTYHEFAKVARVLKNTDRLIVSVYAIDSIGKRVDAGATYLPDERAYLDVTTDNQFDAAEKYAWTMRLAQKINLPVYDFPTLDLWYAHLQGTVDGVNQMQAAVQKGIDKYTRIGQRLILDCGSCQGFWTEQYWGAGFFPAPYTTIKKWGDTITAHNGVPQVYFWTSGGGGDQPTAFCNAHPDWTRWNGTKLRAPDSLYGNHPGWMDFTDTGLVNYLKNTVYANLRSGGVKGMMFDYPYNGWCWGGGYDDPYTTCAGFYRKQFQLAWEGVGPGYIQERMWDTDVTLGVIASKRTEGDTWDLGPGMITKLARRWYKSRVVVHYDMDGKDLNKCPDRESVRSLLTACYATSGVFLLATKFSDLTNENVYDLTRCFPYHSYPKSFRPTTLQGFDGKFYYTVDPQWSQVLFYNGFNGDSRQYSISLSGNTAFSGMGLESGAQYHVYDFWNNAYVGLLTGSGDLSQTLRPNEARMMSVHKRLDVPQFISTNRHIMQGYVDMVSCAWNPSTYRLEGTSHVIGGETYKVIIACNDASPGAVTASSGATASAAIIDGQHGLAELSISSANNADVSWDVSFSGVGAVHGDRPLLIDKSLRIERLHGSIRIRYPQTGNSAVALAIIAPDGKEIAAGKSSVRGMFAESVIDPGRIARGVYMIRVSVPGQAISHKTIF